jgi:hypothetical protein
MKSLVSVKDGMSSWEKEQKQVEDKLKMFAKKSGSDKLKEVARREKMEDSPERNVNQRVIRKIVDNCIELYMTGEYDFHETLKEISEALAAIKEEVKPEKKEEDDNY